MFLKKILILSFFLLELFVFPQNLGKLNSQLAASKNEKEKAACFLNIAYYYEQNNPDSCVFFANKALEINKKTPGTKELAQSYKALAEGYYYKQDYHTALNFILMSSDIYEKLGKNSADFANTLHLTGSIIYETGAVEKSLGYYYKALDILTPKNDSSSLAVIYNDLGYIFQRKLNYDSAFYFFNKTYEIDKAKGDIELISVDENNLGALFFDKRDLNKAEFFMKKCLHNRRKIGQKFSILNSLNNLSALYILRHRYDDAKKLADESILLARELKSKSDLKHSYNRYKMIYQETKKTEMALLYADSSYMLQTEIYNEETSKITNEIEARYQNEKKEKENRLLQMDNQLKNTSIENFKTTRNYLISIIVLAFLIIIAAIYVYRNIKQKNRLLDAQKNSIIEKNHLLEESKKEITDSINYAKRIQYSLLANDELLTANLTEHFILFKPKDIVSGDFYWATKHENRFYLAVCDSTGHGVPGAFMSLLNIGFLSEAIQEKEILEPNKILNYVRKRLTESISNEEQKDGMDAILICIDKTNGTISYAAANNEPVLIQNNQLTELPKDKMPVGKGEKKDSFSLHTIDLQKGDTLYLYTDGFADQFGGAKGKKFKYKQLNDLLMNINTQSMPEQQQKLDSAFQKWKGNLEQVDDVLIIGLKV